MNWKPSAGGIYGGAVGYFSYSGASDTAIAIRTLVAKDGVRLFSGRGRRRSGLRPRRRVRRKLPQGGRSARRPPHGP